MEEKYKIVFFQKSNGRKPAEEYLIKLPKKDRVKVTDYIKGLAIYPEFRKEPLSRHLIGKLRELKIDFSHNRYRMIYFFNIGKVIIILHAFSKKSRKTPRKEIIKAQNYMIEFLNN